MGYKYSFGIFFEKSNKLGSTTCPEKDHKNNNNNKTLIKKKKKKILSNS
jgi:hypothetical protein